MSWAASDIGDNDILSTVADGDTIITGANDTVGNGDQFWGAKVHSIGVRTIMWSYNFHVSSSEIVTVEYGSVESHAVYWSEPINDRVI